MQSTGLCESATCVRTYWGYGWTSGLKVGIALTNSFIEINK